MKILVPVKRVSDPDNANKVKVSADGKSVTTEGLEWKPNPFDEYAVETALRLNENAKGTDKLVHGSIYAVLGWLSARAADSSSLRATLIVLVAVALFGVADEWHQRFIPGRSSDTTDWVADTLGAVTAVLAFQAARRRRESPT